MLAAKRARQLISRQQTLVKTNKLEFIMRFWK
jgi:DNA-directed RNA polymerase subunit K/omega